MNQRDWYETQHFFLKAIVILTFLGALLGGVTGLYGVINYFIKPNYQQQVK
jgi:hypothetical protein